MSVQKSFAEWFANELSARSISQSQAAAFIGSRPQTLSAWLRHDAQPSSDMCLKIANWLHVDPIDVLRVAGHLPPLDRGDLAEDAPGYLSADLTRAVSIARRLISIGGEDALEEWTELGEALLEVKQRRASR